jgi:SCY1-like protein 1
MSAIIELLFKVNDRGVRGAMLGRIALFAKFLDQPTLNRVVCEPMCSGFTDSSAPLRDLTLKSAIILDGVFDAAQFRKIGGM